MTEYRYNWPCEVDGNYDGDTVSLCLDRGFYEHKHVQLRLHQVDTPELSKMRNVPADRVELYKAAGRLARDRVREWLAGRAGHLRAVSLVNVGKYGRPIGDIVCEKTGDRLTAYILGERLGVPYDGGDRGDPAFLERHWQNIQHQILIGALPEDLLG